MSEKNNSKQLITSQSWLNFMWVLHNKLRNARGVKLTGLAALNEINNFLLVFFIERDFDKYKLDDDCKFSYLYEKYCTDKIISSSKNKSSPENNNPTYKKLWDHYCNVGSNMECVVRKLVKNTTIRNIIKSEFYVPSAFTDNSETGETIQDIINYIYKYFASIVGSEDSDLVMSMSLDDFGFDGFGDAYEKFKQESCLDSGKTTGQHFTPDLVKEYVINELKPKSTDVFYEPACGTGGFVHKAMKYLKDNKKKYNKFVENLIAHECNSEIYKPLAINMLIHGIPITNVKKQDSLELSSCDKLKESVDIIATNPPFGSGDLVKSDEYWGPLLTGKNVIKDAMAQFIIHNYQSLKKGGRCGTVSDRGIINNGTDGKNSWQKKLREFILTNTNLYRVVLLPKDTFDYTSFSTCILFFVKGEPTQEVEFRELKFKETIKDGQKIKIIDPESDKAICKVPIEKIKEKNWSLKLEDYLEKKEEKKIGNGWIKLGELCEFYKGYAFKKEEFVLEGIPVLKVSNIQNNNITGLINYVKKDNILNKFIVKKNDIVLVLVGNTYGKMLFYNENTEYYLNQNQTIIRNNNKNINKYIYYYLIFLNKNYTITSNAQPFITIDTLSNILIPNLSLSHQEEIVKFLDSQFEKYDISKLNKQIPIFDLLIRKEYQMASELLHLCYRQMAAEQELENIKKDKQAIFSLSVYGLDAPMMKLGDIVEDIKCGKSISKVNLLDNGIPYFGANGIIGYTNSYLYKGEYILIARNGTIGAVHKFNGEFYPSDHTFVVKPNNNCNINFIFKYLTNCVEWKKLSVHNGMPGITKPILENIKIPVPQLKVQEEIIKKIEDLDSKSSHYSTYAEILQKELDNISKSIENLCKMKEVEEEKDTDIDEEDKVENDNQSNKSNKLTKSTKSTKSTNSDQIEIPEELTDIPKVSKSNKSTKSSKSNKLTKSKLEKKKIISDVDLSDIDLSDIDSSDCEKKVKEKKNKASSQQVNSYKTKAKSNAKYIEESDCSENSDNLYDLEKELARKSK
jgi:type I restriction-modification system DNA methylase subunit